MFENLVAKKLGLKDMGPMKFGRNKCDTCKSDLRIGEDTNKYHQSYCPTCKKIIATVSIPRFTPPIHVQPHDD